MKQPTLDEFIAAYASRPWPANLYVKEKGFKQLYVRISRRFLRGAWYDPTLDLANIEASYPGRGAFTNLVTRLRQQYPNMVLFVESVQTSRFANKLVALGFQPMEHDCFTWFPNQTE